MKKIFIFCSLFFCLGCASQLAAKSVKEQNRERAAHAFQTKNPQVFSLFVKGFC